MIVYIYSKCSTCKKALSFLRDRGGEKSITIKEITQEPPSLSELQKMLSYQNGHLKKLFNTSGQLYREMHLNEKLQDMSLEQALDLLTTHGMLVKRPFLLGPGFGLLGFNEAKWAIHF